MTYTYIPQGVCSSKYTFDIEDGIVRNVKITGGCNGNLKGIASLLEGMKATDAIERMEGVRCGFKPTSCPDQIAQALKAALAQNA
ncbi:MAG: TIGR03905 family TSCPD domain-containing protein [Clostridia bacterium]|nr:TIGR03905 family TSCPD domain-containing protein [Oscillospiraceae bacterium]MBQ2750108.1 TIGR03905 family TSCPD domain-containing protein [Clostridia bacterium]MBR6762301.1 TIGR03905 family TSCPD domain-containing protein [Clostridia bacterium]